MKQTLLVASLLFASRSFACSCIEPNVPRMADNAEFVVLAELKTTNSVHSRGKRKYLFETIKAFKGPGSDRLEVWTEEFTIACGLKATLGVRYVLFVYREDGKLVVSHCSSWPLLKHYSRYTDAFNEFYELTGPDALKADPEAP